MSNNINVTEGAGKTVATEDIGGSQYQKIKLVGGETGSTSVLGIAPDGSIKASVIGTVVVNVTNVPSVTVGNTVSTSIIGLTPVGLNVSGSPVTTANPIAVQPPASGFLPTQVQGSIFAVFVSSSSMVSGVTSIITSTSQTSVLATAPGAQRNYITNVLVTNAATTGTFVDFVDGSNVIYSGYAAANGGGFALSFPSPLKQPTLAQSLDVKARAQASIIAAVSGYTGA